MVSVILPTYNAEFFLPRLLKSLRSQIQRHELIIIDSDSTDRTQSLIKNERIPLHIIEKSSFNHGGTRNIGLELANYDIVVFLTQDAFPANNLAVFNLVNEFNKAQNISIAYGRQLPHDGASVLSQFARLSNYPPESFTKSMIDVPRMGIKTCHCSNSFAAYKKSDLLSVGGFPTDTILGEDVTVAAKLLLQGQRISYCAEAQVYHSHNYSILEEFNRYFDIGVFHYQQGNILAPFSHAEGEGINYVLNELRYLVATNNLELVPSQMLRSFFKYLGYKIGKNHSMLPNLVNRKLSMHKYHWK